jgi:hypothetical protein
MTALRPSGSLVGAIVAAVVSLWLGFAVVAGVTGATPRTVAPAQPIREAAPVGGFALHPAPALRVRWALLERAPATATTAPASPAPMSTPASSAADAATSAPATPESAGAAEPAPSPRPAPAPKPQPRLTAAPTHGSGPDFDESAPGGFDNSG